LLGECLMSDLPRLWDAREFGMPTNWVRCREMGMPVISSWVY